MLRFLIDENFNHRILRGLKRALPGIDYIIAQSAGLKGHRDPEVLSWAAENGRILVTHDLKTIPKHAYERGRAGLPMPGVLAVPDSLPIRNAVEDLVLVAECCTEAELENVVLYLPLR